MKITQYHYDMTRRAANAVVRDMDRRGLDTAFGAGGAVGEEVIEYLRGVNETPEDIEAAQRLVMAGMCGDWPEKYGWYPDDDLALAILRPVHAVAA